MPGLHVARPIFALAMLFLVGGLMYGFTASNVVSSENRAGQGADDISGYEITNIRYSLVSGFPNRVTAVVFDMDAPDPATTTAYARFPASAGGTGAWKLCELLELPNTWICSGFAEFVTNINSLEVVAAQ